MSLSISAAVISILVYFLLMKAYENHILRPWIFTCKNIFFILIQICSLPSRIPAFQTTSCMFLIALVIFASLCIVNMSFAIPAERQTFCFTNKYITISFLFLPLECNSPGIWPRYCKEKSLGLFLFGKRFQVDVAVLGKASKGRTGRVQYLHLLCEPCWNTGFDKALVHGSDNQLPLVWSIRTAQLRGRQLMAQCTECSYSKASAVFPK